MRRVRAAIFVEDGGWSCDWGNLGWMGADAESRRRKAT